MKCWGSSGGEGGLGNADLGESERNTGAGDGADERSDASRDDFVFVMRAPRHGCRENVGGPALTGRWAMAGVVNRASPVSPPALSSGVTFIGGGASSEDGNNASRHMCAVLGAGVKCWGKNEHGQLGNGSAADVVATPVVVTGLVQTVVAVTTGAYHSCALTSQGAVWCWGQNDVGQLGNAGGETHVPTAIGALAGGVKSITAGAYHTCAVMMSGELWCWGKNDRGQLRPGRLGGVDERADARHGALTSAPRAQFVWWCAVRRARSANGARLALPYFRICAGERRLLDGARRLSSPKGRSMRQLFGLVSVVALVGTAVDRLCGGGSRSCPGGHRAFERVVVR